MCRSTTSNLSGESKGTRKGTSKRSMLWRVQGRSGCNCKNTETKRKCSYLFRTWTCRSTTWLLDRSRNRSGMTSNS